MYTKEGNKVELVKKIEGGYLAKNIIIIHGEYEDYEESEDTIIFFEELYETPPTKKYADEVSKLISEQTYLLEEIKKLKKEKIEDSYIKDRLKDFPIIKNLFDYLTGNFNFILFLRNMECRKKSSTYISKFIRTSNTKLEPFALYELKYENDISDSEDKAFLVFANEEDMQLEAKQRLISKLNLICSQNYNSSGRLKDFFRQIDDSCLAKKDVEFLSLYNSKLKEQEDKERKEQEDAIKKQLDDLKAKQIALEKKQPTKTLQYQK